MSHPYFDVAFTDAVKAEQVRYGSRRGPVTAASFNASKPHQRLDDAARTFVGRRDGFYLASVSASGWPYVQYRGGPAGFVRVVDPHTLGWADFAGNGQYISAGNVAGDDRVALFFMDYARQTRLKLYGHATVEDVREHPIRSEAFEVSGYAAVVERVVTVAVVAYDWNCPEHITPKFTLEEITAASARATADVRHET